MRDYDTVTLHMISVRNLLLGADHPSPRCSLQPFANRSLHALVWSVDGVWHQIPSHLFCRSHNVFQDSIVKPQHTSACWVVVRVREGRGDADARKVYVLGFFVRLDSSCVVFVAITCV